MAFCHWMGVMREDKHGRVQDEMFFSGIVERTFFHHLSAMCTDNPSQLLDKSLIYAHVLIISILRDRTTKMRVRMVNEGEREQSCYCQVWLMTLLKRCLVLTRYDPTTFSVHNVPYEPHGVVCSLTLHAAQLADHACRKQAQRCGHSARATDIRDR